MAFTSIEVIAVDVRLNYMVNLEQDGSHVSFVCVHFASMQVNMCIQTENFQTYVILEPG